MAPYRESLLTPSLELHPHLTLYIHSPDLLFHFCCHHVCSFTSLPSRLLCHLELRVQQHQTCVHPQLQLLAFLLQVKPGCALLKSLLMHCSQHGLFFFYILPNYRSDPGVSALLASSFQTLSSVKFVPSDFVTFSPALLSSRELSCLRYLIKLAPRSQSFYYSTIILLDFLLTDFSIHVDDTSSTFNSQFLDLPTL